MNFVTRRLLAQIALIVLPVSVLCIVLVTSSKTAHYLDFSLNFIADKYQGVWPLMLADLLIFFGILASIAIYQGWNGSALKRLIIKPSGSAIHDLAMVILRITYISEVIVYLLTFGIAKRLTWHIKDFFDFENSWIPSFDNIVIQQIIFLLLIDFVYYWMHRIEHTTPFLWAYHKFHHSASEMNVITSRRVHPIESDFIKAIFFALPFALLGIPLYSFILIRIIIKVHGAIVHSGLNWNWGWFGKYILLSPKYHSIHHSKAPEHQNRNYANHFPIFDHLFGTYCAEEVNHIAYGVDDDNHNNTNLLHALWTGVTESFNALTLFLSGEKASRTTISHDSRQSDDTEILYDERK